MIGRPTLGGHQISSSIEDIMPDCNVYVVMHVHVIIIIEVSCIYFCSIII